MSLPLIGWPLLFTIVSPAIINFNISDYHDDIRAYIIDEPRLVPSLLFNYMSKLILFALPHFEPAQKGPQGRNWEQGREKEVRTQIQYEDTGGNACQRSVSVSKKASPRR